MYSSMEGLRHREYVPTLASPKLTGCRFTKADNSGVITTDSVKNTVYILAKQHSVTPPELFATTIGTHFIGTYRHIQSAHVKIVVHRWTRMNVDGKPHPHSFIRDGAETRNVEATVDRENGVRIRSAIQGLLVLKSTGSAFHSFLRDEFTTLPEVDDRILSTEVDCGWAWNAFDDISGVEMAIPKFDEAWDAARKITLDTFATDRSASVQNTMYKMCEQILTAVPTVRAVDYSLPNKHYFEIGWYSYCPYPLVRTDVGLDLSWHNGLKNTGKDAEVYLPQSAPNGRIQCTVTR